MQEQYFKKSVLAVLFNETLKRNPDKREFLMELWTNIKSLGDNNEVCADCSECKMQDRCTMLSAASELFRRHHSIKGTDEYWHDLVLESGNICESNGNHRFVKNLVQAVIEELSETQREVNKN